jgi:hypothetical protein
MADYHKKLNIVWANQIMKDKYEKAEGYKSHNFKSIGDEDRSRHTIASANRTRPKGQVPLPSGHIHEPLIALATVQATWPCRHWGSRTVYCSWEPPIPGAEVAAPTHLQKPRCSKGMIAFLCVCTATATAKTSTDDEDSPHSSCCGQ